MSKTVPADDQSNLFSDVSKAVQWSTERIVAPNVIPYLKQSQVEKEKSSLQLEYLVLTNIVFPDSKETESVPQTSCLLSQATREALKEDFTTPISKPNPAIYEVKNHNTRTGELGLFASINMGPGDIILTERPIIVVPSLLWLDNISETPINLFTQLFQRVPVGLRDTARAMMNVHEDCSKEEGILRTNGLAITMDTLRTKNEAHIALFATTGRVNHR